MRTGVSYMGSHNPRHMKADLADMKSLHCDDVLLAAQENDFVYMTGKLKFLPAIARDLGVRPIAIFWGALNLFGGGRSSQFLLEHPQAHQVKKDGSWNPEGCYNNPAALKRITDMIDIVAGHGFEGYFVDEPTPLDCYCKSCAALYEQWIGGSLHEAPADRVKTFRGRCVNHYIQVISAHVKRHHPKMETMCCLMPHDKECWASAATVKELDNLGTDIYWVNTDLEVEGMTPLVRDMAAMCKQHGKTHHEWLQLFHVHKGKEDRVLAQGKILVRERPDALYLWAYESQVGTTETSEDPAAAWERGKAILRMKFE